jgi:thiazolylpeptide-type bacteriocin precursor
MALNEKLEGLDDLSIEIDALEISDFLDESRFADAEEVSKVMAASCTTCECCCSVS